MVLGDELFESAVGAGGLSCCAWAWDTGGRVEVSTGDSVEAGSGAGGTELTADGVT